MNYREEETVAEESSCYHANYLQHQKTVMSIRNSSNSKQSDLQSEEKPFKCPFCTRSFNQNSNLVIHIRVHTGEKPFSCSLCEKASSTSSSLCLHTRVHTGQKPFRCTLCEKSYSNLLISENTQEVTLGKNYLIVQCMRNPSEIQNILRYT